MLISFWLVCIKLTENVVISSVCEISFVQQLGIRSTEFLREKSRKLFITPSFVLLLHIFIAHRTARQSKRKQRFLSWELDLQCLLMQVDEVMLLVGSESDGHLSI